MGISILHKMKSGVLSVAWSLFALGFWLLWLPTTFGGGELDHKGTEFILSFLDNNSTLEPELHIISQQATIANVTLSIPQDTTFHRDTREVHKDEVTSVRFNRSVRMSGNTKEYKGIHIEASSDIVVYGVNRGNGSTDAYLALPLDALGDEYYVASFNLQRPYISQVGIVSVVNGTRVTISIPRLNRKTVINYGNRTYVEGDTFNISLDRFESTQIQSHSDLTGLKICADKTVVVFSGDTSTVVDIANSYTWNDHFVEQLSPTKSWGRSFATVPFSDGNGGDIFRVIARANDTNVKVRRSKTSSSYNLSESEHAEINISRNDYISVLSDKPVMVVQYLMAESTWNTKCESFMMIVPPIEQGERQYLFSIVASASKHSVNLVINSSMIEGLLLDGQTLVNTSSHWITIEGFASNYSATQLAVKGGFHNLSHKSTDASFSAVSYGYPLGMRLKNLPSYMASNKYFVRDRIRHIENNLAAKAGNQANGFNLANNGFPVEEEGLASTVIAVIASLCAAIFFVIVCIAGFLLAECVCRRRDEWRSAKVMPLVG